MFLVPQALHFTGIGGIGMSGLAGLCLALGCKVEGSDLALSPAARRLAAMGVLVREGHDASYVAPDASALVMSSAVRADNPEVAEARRRGLPVVLRGELLAELMRPRRGIAVAGSHGKTSTSSMIAAALIHSGLDPTVAVGGTLAVLGGSNARLGAGDLMVAETDESDGSFLLLSPEIAVLTNVDREHVEHYGGFEHARSAFADFVNRTAFCGLALVCVDDLEARALLPRLRRRVIGYGRSADAGLRAVAEVADESGSEWTVLHRGRDLGRFRLDALGAHSVLNATAAIGACLEAGAPLEAVREALRSFQGPERRLEVKGEARGVRVVDDYGHHPAEIRAALQALRQSRPGRIVVLFQPHRYTRTRALLDEFAGCFEEADAVRVLDIYAASEPPIAGVTGEALARRIRAAGHPDARYAGPLRGGADAVAAELRPGDVVLTLGAGSITQAGDLILEHLREAAGHA
jgi:UDP-N-acetylmuramate--alanine ligase